MKQLHPEFERIKSKLKQYPNFVEPISISPSESYFTLE